MKKWHLALQDSPFHYEVSMAVEASLCLGWSWCFTALDLDATICLGVFFDLFMTETLMKNKHMADITQQSTGACAWEHIEKAGGTNTLSKRDLIK